MTNTGLLQTTESVLTLKPKFVPSSLLPLLRCHCSGLAVPGTHVFATALAYAGKVPCYMPPTYPFSCRLMFFEHAREVAEKEFQANPRDAVVSNLQHG